MASVAWIAVLVNDLQLNDMESSLEEFFALYFEHFLQVEVVAPFWRCLARPGDSEGMRLEQLRCAFHHVTQTILDVLKALDTVASEPAERLERLKISAMNILDALLLLEPPNHFRVYVEQLLETSHRCVMKSSLPLSSPSRKQCGQDEDEENDEDGRNVSMNEEDNDVSEACESCLASTASACTCLCFADTVKFLAESLNLLQLGNRIFSQPYVLDLIRGKVERYVAAQCSRVYNKESLRKLERWYTGVFHTWLAYMGVNMGRLTRHRRQNGDQAKLVIYQAYAKVRIAELFDIIVDYPDSRPALLELKKAVEVADMRGHMMMSAKAAIRRRLLHPGVQTEAVLSAYIAAVRALRLLDPSGVAQELVCQPITRYLRQRDDAIRAIITKIISDEGAGELASELTRPAPLEVCGSATEDDDPDMNNWNEWKPDPVEARLASAGSAGSALRSSDLLTLLVGIYGSKELFVSEYRNLLSNRLLAQLSFDTEREIRNLELLKLRFGDANLNQCEVMLKDLADSRRLNLLVADMDANGTKPKVRSCGLPSVTGFVLSAQFWPVFRQEQLTLPQPLQHCLDDFRRCFESLKGNRTLNWLPSQGQMRLEVLVGGKRLEVDCAPLQAAALLLFTERSEWSLSELAALLHVPAFQLRRRLAFWAQMGVLRDVGGGGGDRFALSTISNNATDAVDILNSNGSVLTSCDECLLVEEEPIEKSSITLADQRAAELQVLWTYVVGMLTNLGSLSLDRIYSMLKAFFMAGTSSMEFSRDEIKALLNQKVKELKLVYFDDTFRLS